METDAQRMQLTNVRNRAAATEQKLAAMTARFEEASAAQTT